jgi:hypothetical protein
LTLVMGVPKFRQRWTGPSCGCHTGASVGVLGWRTSGDHIIDLLSRGPIMLRAMSSVALGSPDIASYASIFCTLAN